MKLKNHLVKIKDFIFKWKGIFLISFFISLLLLILFSLFSTQKIFLQNVYVSIVVSIFVAIIVINICNTKSHIENTNFLTTIRNLLYSIIMIILSVIILQVLIWISIQNSEAFIDKSHNPIKFLISSFKSENASNSSSESANQEGISKSSKTQNTKGEVNQEPLPQAPGETGKNNVNGNDKNKESTEDVTGKILGHTENILSKTSILLNYLMIIFAIITILCTFAFFEAIRKYNKFKKTISLIDENLAAATSIAMSVVPELNYSYIIPESFLPLLERLDDITDKLMEEGEEKILKYSGGGRILIALGDKEFLNGFGNNAVTFWEKVYHYRNSTNDEKLMSLLRLTIGYNHLENNIKTKIFLKDLSLQGFKHQSILFRILWFYDQEEDKKLIDEEKNYIKTRINNRKAASICLPEDIPIFFAGGILFADNEDQVLKSLSVKSLSLFAQAVHSYLGDELKKSNYNIVLSWLASLLGLAIFINKKVGQDIFKQGEINDECLSIKCNLNNFITETAQIGREDYPNLYAKCNTNVKNYWLSFKFENDNIILLGKFVDLAAIKKFINKALEEIDDL